MKSSLVQSTSVETLPARSRADWRCVSCGHHGFEIGEGAGTAGRTALSCAACKREYPCVDGVWQAASGDAYLESFAFEWQRHRRTMFDEDGRQGTEFTLRKFGWSPEICAGKRVLDVGCGSGRFTDVLRRWGATVVAVDLSAAVWVARENLKGDAGVECWHADLMALPFQPGTFDLVLGWGVLHHTPDCAAAFARVAAMVKPGGRLAVYVYGKSKGVRRRMFTFYRGITPRLPRKLLYALCHLAGPLHYVCKIPLLGNLLRILLPTSRQQDWRERVLETFDEYAPRYASRHSFPEVHRWFVDAGFEHIHIYDSPVHAEGRAKVADWQEPSRGANAGMRSHKDLAQKNQATGHSELSRNVDCQV